MKFHSSMNNQAKVLMASFVYFAEVMEKNNLLNDIPKEFQVMFRKLSWITEKYQKHYGDVINEVNGILKPLNKDVDYLLMSVSLITEYYRQMRGKKRHFTPLNYKQIIKVEEDCIEASKLNVNDTFDVAEIIVRELLKEK